MKQRKSIQLLLSSVFILSMLGCATVPTIVPQALIDARSALSSAKEVKADIMIPDEYQEARRRLEQAEGAFSADQSIATVEELSFEAKAYAEVAEAHARVRITEQEYETTQQALITQQTMLQTLTVKNAEIQRVKDQIKKSEEDKRLAQAQAEAAAKQAEAERKKREELQKMMEEAKKIKNANVTMEARGLVISLSGKVLFDTGSSKVRAGAKSALDGVSGFVRNYTQYKVKIEGHTDSTGSDLTNNTLSQARAENVLNYLQQQGVPFDSMMAVGLGSARPIATNNTPTGRQLNRRVEIILEKKPETPKVQ
ncbi:OmpA family protein [bacterium]|nr:OmpA family protein [bacterium]